MFCRCPVHVTNDQETILAFQKTMVLEAMVLEAMVLEAMVQTATVEIVPGAIEIHLRALEQTGRRPLSTLAKKRATASLPREKG